MWVGDQRQTPAALTLGKTGCPLCRRLNGSQDRNGRVRKSSPRRDSILEPFSQQRVATTTALSWPDCTQHCYMLDTFPSHSHSAKNPKQIQFPEEGSSTILRSIRTYFLSKATSEFVVILTPVMHSVARGSRLNTETGYPDFVVSVVVYWIPSNIPVFTLIRS